MKVNQRTHTGQLNGNAPGSTSFAKLKQKIRSDVLFNLPVNPQRKLSGINNRSVLSTKLHSSGGPKFIDGLSILEKDISTAGDLIKALSSSIMLGADATKYVVKKFHHLKQDQKAAFLKGISKLHNDARNSTTKRASLEQVEGLHSLILETTLEVKNSIPTEHCYEIFDALLSSIKNAGPATRSRVLTMLASKLAEIPRNRRPSMFDRLLTESDALSLNLRVRPLSALASVLNKLPDGFVDSRLRKLAQRILAQDIGDQIEPLSTLMSEIDQLSGEDRLSIVYHLLNAADSCNTEAKAPALAVLANSIELLREVHRLQVFQFVLKAIGDLESRERIEPLRALASECAELPEANRMDGLDDLLGAVAAIVDPGVKGELLHAIASGARKFFEAGLVGAFGHILASINLLDVEERAAPLLALRANIRWLPEEARQEAMHDLLLFS